MILVDSSVWVDYFRGVSAPHTDKLDSLLGRELILVGDLILLEVLQGFEEEAQFQAARRALAAFETLELGGASIAIQAARNYRELRRRGITIRKTADTLVATRCIEDGLTLLHHDRDFEPFRKHLGLRTL